MSLWDVLYKGDNFGKVDDRVYRGAQPNKDELKRLRIDSHFNIKVNLNLRNDLQPEEQAEVEAAGMKFINIPMRDDRAPDPADIKRIIEILQKATPFEAVFVNCKGGKHRTGVAIGVYQVMIHHMSIADAWAEAKQYHFYRTFGHGPIEDWFLHDFTPALILNA